MVSVGQARADEAVVRDRLEFEASIAEDDSQETIDSCFQPGSVVIDSCFLPEAIDNCFWAEDNPVGSLQGTQVEKFNSDIFAEPNDTFFATEETNQVEYFHQDCLQIDQVDYSCPSQLATSLPC